MKTVLMYVMNHGRLCPLVIGAMLLTLGIAQATTLTVDNAGDAGGICPGATCTLRRAIAAASPGDTIDFAAGITTIIANPLPDPTLELRDGNGLLIAFDDNWRDNPAQAALIMGAGVQSRNDLEAAIAATLPPGTYTAIVAAEVGASESVWLRSIT